MSAVIRLLDSDFIYGFLRSPIAVISALILLICVLAAIFAPWVAPHNPFDLADLSLMDSLKPPAFLPGGDISFPLGTDDQGRDMLSGMMYGARISMFVSALAVILAL
ncbi:MAG TPA: ABC transporter permease, partial [Acetobacteraceae bacterium]